MSLPPILRRDFWIADAELSARLSAVDEDIDRRERAARSNDDIAMPFRREANPAVLAAIPGLVAVILLVVAVIIR
ncbi:hypothetical protein [Microbacterium hominis]|uniref:Uncharacterized protein n=1 Tax=Microbacterium hominis TaxID=162426 RepID=A0A2K9D9J0_9MICO|nr:hypothetical protein [Microbacterium hominis]AUG28791.1 hypothetical protein CXR34_04410 [Microbacterium hominis]